MNINVEKAKAKFVYGLELRKIILDKVLFGILLLIFGMVTNVLLENYRNNLTKERFLLEQQLDAINNIKSAHDELVDIFDTATVGTHIKDKPISDEVKKQFQKKLDTFILQTNKFNVLFPKNFDRQMTFFVWSYSGSIDEVLNKWVSMSEEDRITNRTFVNETRKLFYDLCRESLGFDKETRSTDFVFEDWSFSKGSQYGSNAYYQTNFKNWQSMNR
jgi:hypothetical protein